MYDKQQNFLMVEQSPLSSRIGSIEKNKIYLLDKSF